ncbi:hypothetical protein Tco_0039300 [Tanacetum coccineum]
MVNLFLKHGLVSMTYFKKSLIMAFIFGSKSIFYDHVSYPLKREIDHSVGGKLRDKSVEESWEIIEDLSLYDNEFWNDPKDLAKPAKLYGDTHYKDGKVREAIYKQREEINERMAEKFSLLKEYTKWKAPEKVFVREEVSKPVTKYVNAISLVRIEDDNDDKCDEVIDKKVIEPIKVAEKE